MEKKVWKTKNFLNSSKFQGHNSCKNKSISPKTQTGTVTLDYKVTSQVSILQLQRWPKSSPKNFLKI
jgi:hypothetical protein